MKTDNLREYVRLRTDLTKEKASLEARLKQINEALGEVPLPSLSAVEGATGGGIRDYSRLTIGRDSGAGRSQGAGPRRRGRRPAGGGLSLREHVIAVLQEGPKSKEEVLEAVQRRGYKFASKNPMNSLGVVLYGKNPKFGRVDGKFSVDGGAEPTRAMERPQSTQPGRKGAMSAAGRAAIAAA